MKLSDNFTLSEFIFSEMADLHGIDNSPQSPVLIEAMGTLAKCILQPIRDRYGVITLMSGYRCKKLNKRVSKSSTSQHMKGEAADFTCNNLPRVMHWIVYNSGLDFDQVIYYPDKNIIHISHTKRKDNRHEVSFDSGKTFKIIFTKGQS